ncbi:MAG: response regulator, partial [Bacteroidota bacterium]
NVRAVSILVKDNGKGIDPAQHEQVFKRFYEKTEGSENMLKGLGIGLALSKEMIALHHGSIELESEAGAGACFIVRLLHGSQHFEDEEIIAKSSYATSVPSTVDLLQTTTDESMPTSQQPPAETNKVLPKLLIVEDNPEMQQFVQRIFSDHYSIRLAPNGREGLKAVQEWAPNLVISDVMMPEMDGNELCHKIKSDVNISHIPVLLLTARNADNYKLQGLRLGADDYVTKPFSPEELRLRVKNLIHSREEIRSKFLRVVNIEAREITVTSADEDFLNRAINIAHEQMDNTNFAIDQFAHELAVSRPLLFTKLKALTGQTPNNFIKTIRLKQAAQLLSQNKLNVAEVAYRVGFRDPKYFSKCFQKQFGASPIQYSRQQVEETGDR